MKTSEKTDGWVDGDVPTSFSGKSMLEKSRASKDLIVLSVLSVVVSVAAFSLNLGDKVVGWAVKYEDWEVDELLILGTTLLLGLAVFSIRRWREYRHELTRRLRAEELLQLSHSELEKRVEERTKDLRETKERLAHILSSNPAVIYTAKPGGDFGATFISDRITAQLGYEPREFLEDPSFWASHIHPEDAPRILQGLSPLFEQGHHVHEYRFRHKDGSYRWMRDELNLTRDENGNPVEIIGYWIDITERKQAEEELRIRDQAIKTSINAIHFANPDGTTIFANDSFLKMWGFQGIDDAVGVHISELADDKEEFCRVFAEFQEKGFYVGEITARRQDGTPFEAQISASSVLDDSGKPVCIMASFLDITDRKQAEEALRKAKDGLELRVQERTSELKTMNEDLLLQIAERKIAEQALGESEERYRELVENSNDIVFQINTEGFFTFVNRAASRISGYSEEELIGLHFTDLILPDYRKETEKFYCSKFVKKIPNTYYEFPFKTKQGKIMWVGQNVQPITREDQIVGFQSIARDITDRKEMEKALQDSEERFRSLIDQAADAIFVHDLDGRFLEVNRQGCASLGYTRDELLFMSVTDVDPDAVPRGDSAIFWSNLPATFEAKHRRKDGTTFPVEIRLGAIEYGESKVVLAMARDLSNRKEAEEALRKSEEFNRRMVEQAPFGIVYLAGDGTLEYVNPAGNRIAGIPEGQVSPVLGRNILELPGFQDSSKAQEDLRRLLEDESLSDFEVPYKSSMGRDTVLLVAATPRFDTDGTVGGAILMFMDISEHKRAEELQRETARYRAVADLAGGVAHNFNNLLQIVIGYLELALIDLEMGNYSDIKDALEKVLESSRFGAETVRRLQSFAGIRDHSQVPERGVFDLCGIVRQAVEMTKTWWKTIPEKEGRKVFLDIHVQDGCLVQCEKNELFEVVVNLIKNATEALSQGGAIDVETRVEGDRVVLKVRDTGVGISEQNLKRLFNPFFTTKASAGSGLGLASSRKIIEDCGGNILADSAEGKGTTFTVVLPLAKEELKPPRTEKTPPTVQPLTVLAIDDEEAILDLLKNALTRHNYEVLTALSGEMGLDIFKENPVEIVICDLGMPGMTGWEVGKRIRAICEERGIKKTFFILLTGWGGQKTEVAKIAESGVDVIIEKPLNIKNMLEAVREVAEKVLSENTDE